jgi:hypothetical protein
LTVGSRANAIADHLAKADLVPVDVSQFSPEQIDMVEQFIKQYGSSWWGSDGSDH